MEFAVEAQKLLTISLEGSGIKNKSDYVRDKRPACQH